MAIASEKGVSLNFKSHIHPILTLASETPGVVLEVLPENVQQCLNICQSFHVPSILIGHIQASSNEPMLTLNFGDVCLYSESLTTIKSFWSEYSNHMLINTCAPLGEVERAYFYDYGHCNHDFGTLTQALLNNELWFFRATYKEVKVLVLEVFGHTTSSSMLAALANSGFNPLTIPATKLHTLRDLNSFQGLIVAGQSQFNEALAGSRMAATYAVEEQRDILLPFLQRHDTFSLFCGECAFYFCHTLGMFGDPGPVTGLTPRPIELEQNISGQFDCLWLNVKIDKSKSIFLQPLQNMIIPCWVTGSHLGLRFHSDLIQATLERNQLVSASFHGASTNPEDYAKHYPRNPSGNSPIAGLTSTDGKHTFLLFDPSLTFSPGQWQYKPPTLKNLHTSPWALPFSHMYLWCLANRE